MIFSCYGGFLHQGRWEDGFFRIGEGVSESPFFKISLDCRLDPAMGDWLDRPAAGDVAREEGLEIVTENCSPSRFLHGTCSKAAAFYSAQQRATGRG